MRTIVTLFIFLVVGYVGSRRLVSIAVRKYPWNGLLVTGGEFLILGAILGPHAAGLISAGVIRDLEPVIYLTLGSIGMLVGLEVTWLQIRKVSRPVFRAVAGDALKMFLVVAPATYALIALIWPQYPAAERVLAAATLGLTAAVSSPTLLALLARILPARGVFTGTAKAVIALSPLLPLIAFGFVFTVVHPRFTAGHALGSGLVWWLFLNGLAAALGFFMVLFTRERCSDDEMLLLIVGTALVVGGVCYFLQLSSLYTGMVMGFVVGNLSRKRDQIFRELHLIERILYVAFLILVGAMLVVNGWRLFALAGAYIVLRLALKWASTGGAVRSAVPGLASLPRRTGLVFSAQGGLALAMALDCALASDSTLAGSILSVVAMGVLVNDVLAVFLTRAALVGAGEVVETAARRRRREQAP